MEDNRTGRQGSTAGGPGAAGALRVEDRCDCSAYVIMHQAGPSGPPGLRSANSGQLSRMLAIEKATV